MNRRAHGISWRAVRVWQRNLDVWKKGWRINFLPPVIEPVFYILAFGAGLGQMIEVVHYRGAELTYVQFIIPAIISISMMYASFFETSYASFVRMYYQKTFNAMMTTPLSAYDVIGGELIWGCTKPLFFSGILLTVVTVIGPFVTDDALLVFPHALLILPFSFVAGIAFACTGMLCTALVPHIEDFNIPFFLFVTPMFLFSGTFFPLEQLPAWAQTAALVFPLTHTVTVVRAACLGQLSAGLWFSVGMLLVWTLIFGWLALHLMRRRLLSSQLPG